MILKHDLLRVITIRITAVILMYLKWLLSPIYWILSLKRPIKIPPIEDPLLELSGTTLARMIRKKEIKCEHLVEKYIERIKKVNGILNAIVDERFLLAIRDAKRVDQYLFHTVLSEEELTLKKPLLGLPITVKESCKIQGLSFAVGCKTRLGFIAEEDGEGVAKLKKAGAIILLVSNTPEACFGMECFNYITGTTYNPYNTNYTCGGSSGGEASLVAAAASVLGFGSDVGGSIRIPCMFNGIFGHKPTSGVSPIGGHYPICDDKNFHNFLTVGPMVRYAEDLKLLMKVLVDEAVDLDEEVDIDKLTIFYMEDMGNHLLHVPVENEISAAMLNSIKYLRSCGSKISDVKFEELSCSLDMATWMIFNVDNKPDLLVNQNNPTEKYNFFMEIIRYLFSRSTLGYNALMYSFLDRTSALVSRANQSQYKELADVLTSKFHVSCLSSNKLLTHWWKFYSKKHLGKYGVFLYPTFPTSAFQHKQDALHVMALSYSLVFNVLGFPSTHVPLGLNKKGLPIGIQVVANPGRDILCITVAEVLEKAFGGWVSPYKNF